MSDPVHPLHRDRLILLEAIQQQKLLLDQEESLGRSLAQHRHELKRLQARLQVVRRKIEND